ncbi:MAG: hypothetical protein IJ279_00700 [Clostridia bacterium]|nr:hypothetical protein [Clostridia bacterium]
MQAFIDYVKEYWYLVLALVVATIAMLLMFRKAGASAAKNRAEKEKLIKKLDHMKMIRETYSDLTKEKILADETENLVEGVADNIQVRLEKSGDMSAAFEELKEEEKLVYSLHYFIEESEKAPSEFFKNYTKPLTPYALQMCEKITDSSTYSLVKNLYDCYDEDNETESVIKEKTDELDEKIKASSDMKLLKKKGADFIKENAEKFA